MLIRGLGATACLFILLATAGFTPAKEGTDGVSGRNVADMKFGPAPGLPGCATMAVQSGDPTKGPSILLARMSNGCVIPWHWHTPVEHVMMVSGKASMQMKGEKAVTLGPGGYARMPTHHVHQFRALSNCLLFVHSDAAFDIHYVNAAGKEIPAADALGPASRRSR